MKNNGSWIYTVRKYLLTGISICFAVIILVFVISGLFPKKVPFVDTMRVSIQKLFLSSISVIRYPHVSAHDQGIDTHILQKIQAVLLPGDIIFSYRAGFVTNDLIEGERKHASVYLGTKKSVKQLLQNTTSMTTGDYSFFTQGKNTDLVIIDSTERGVALRSFKELTYLDGILIVRVEKPQKQIATMIHTLIDHLGKPYNYDFDMQDTSSIYCAQLIHEGVAALHINIPYTSLAGRAYLYPQDIVDYIFASGVQNNEFRIITAIKDIQSYATIYQYDKKAGILLPK